MSEPQPYKQFQQFMQCNDCKKLTAGFCYKHNNMSSDKIEKLRKEWKEHNKEMMFCAHEEEDGVADFFLSHLPQEAKEKCGFMILTPSPEHNGGAWCAEPYPCKDHGEWKKELQYLTVKPKVKVEGWEKKFDKLMTYHYHYYCANRLTNSQRLQGKNRLKNFIRSLLSKQKYTREEVDKLLSSREAEMVEGIKQLPSTRPEYESDEFDRGMKQMKSDILEYLRR